MNKENKKNETYDDKKTNINWYPGHMLKTKKQITEDLKLIDVVIEILDARIPISSRNPDIQKIIENKKRIIILNKSDLAEEQENKKWINKFKNDGTIAIQTDCNLGNGINECLKQIENILKEDMEKAKQKGRVNKNIRVMILGIPNVGKSSFINRMCNRKSAIVGNRPGVTKQKQWVKIKNNIELLDTPGVLWPKFEDQKTALNLAYTGTIKDDVIDKGEVAYSLLKYLYKNYKNKLFERYNLTDEEIDEEKENNQYEEDETINIMNVIAKKRGTILSKENIDYEKISTILLNEFRNGKLGKITLEKVKEK